MFLRSKTTLPEPSEALPGRTERPFPLAERHRALDAPLMTDEIGVGAIMRGWREMVWRHAENLVTARTPLQKQLAERAIEEYAASQAQMIRQMFATSDGSKARDTYCADHG